mgnify:CR=1 FL=1
MSDGPATAETKTRPRAKPKPKTERPWRLKVILLAVTEDPALPVPPE